LEGFKKSMAWTDYIKPRIEAQIVQSKETAVRLLRNNNPEKVYKATQQSHRAEAMEWLLGLPDDLIKATETEQIQKEKVNGR